MRFKDLSIGDTFDFIGPVASFNLFYLRCVKTGQRSYADEHGGRHVVGSTSAKVYHAEDAPQEELV